MLKERAIEEAKRVAKQSGVTIAVCYVPIETAEEEGDWGYCPVATMGVLFPEGSDRYHITPSGEAARF